MQILNKMQKGNNLTKLFKQISVVENMHNNATRKIYDDDFIAVVLDTAPLECQSLLTRDTWQNVCLAYKIYKSGHFSIEGNAM